MSTLPSPSRALRDPLAVAEALGRAFGATAAERDRLGGTPLKERAALRASGLLSLAVPADLGGGGASWTTMLATVRAIARADGSLAHVYGFQHLIVATLRLFGGPEVFAKHARETADRRIFWGNALNPLDPRTTLVRSPGGAGVMNGEKSFCSGARDADRLLVSAIDAATGKLVVAALPADRAGITARDDWNNMGQRQTDSGSVAFRDVVVHEDEFLTTPGPLGNTFATLRPCLSQAILANVILGIAQGAFETGRALTLDRGRAWFASGVERITDDRFVLAQIGDHYAELEGARAVTDAAGAALDEAWSQGDALTVDGRGACAVAIAAAKVLTTRVGLAVTSGIFEAAGARATTASLGLDRFWRNLRTLTLHDPVDYKRVDLGKWLLTESWPAPSFYS